MTVRLLTNIGRLWTGSEGWSNAAILLQDERIAWVGPASELPTSIPGVIHNIVDVDHVENLGGALVTPGSGIVTSVSTVDPIKVYFTVGEPQYLAWRQRFPTDADRQQADKDFGDRVSEGSFVTCAGEADRSDPGEGTSTGSGADRQRAANRSGARRSHYCDLAR